MERTPYDSHKLEPLSPSEGLEMFLSEKCDDLAQSTLQSYRRRINHFIRYCETRDIDNLNNLTGRDLYRFRVFRRDEGDLAKPSLKSQLTAVRSFIKFAERIDACPEDLHRDVVLPSMNPGEDVRDNIIAVEEAQQIIDYLDKFHYASYRHALFATAWETHLRTGTLHSLDVSDLLVEEQALRIEHRPDTGTRLKNGRRANRVIAISSDLVSILTDHIEHERPSIEDKYGRKPLFASQQGRMSKSNLRQTCYAVTRPCFYTDECPAGRDLDDCQATKYEYATSCPDSESLHAVRRGGITYRLSEDVPMEVVSDRGNVSRRVLEEHYDARDEMTRMAQRRKHLNLD
ncbi:tyrosine-type recombinase/integrase [Halobellus rubicundus]|uniref:Tyrosine-type recombinase/integrase n=1 Tax=Halobellus rubicundus TaxID=2996466 RepID=A0ABD5M988_9EURY